PGWLRVAPAADGGRTRVPARRVDRGVHARPCDDAVQITRPEEFLEHFPLVLSTRPWYFSRSGGADGCGVFDGPADTRAEGCGRGSRVEGPRRAVSRQPGVGRRAEATPPRNGRIRPAQTDEISQPRARDGRSGSVGGD